jgi:hypothetical protein
MLLVRGLAAWGVPAPVIVVLRLLALLVVVRLVLNQTFGESGALLTVSLSKCQCAVAFGRLYAVMIEWKDAARDLRHDAPHLLRSNAQKHS